MLEPGEYPNLAFWEKKEAYIRSMRPLKMVKNTVTTCNLHDLHLCVRNNVLRWLDFSRLTKM